MNKEESEIQQAKMAAMGEMIGNIAHQWRQPLNALSALNIGLSMKHKKGTLNDEVMDTFKQTSNEIIQSMSETIDDFRNFFQPDKVKELFNINIAIAGSIRFVSDSYHQNNIEVILDLKKNIMIASYKNELMQVLLNIFNNSKDAIVEKQVANPKIFISTAESEHQVMIYIQDNAGGVEEKILERIFEPYFTTKFQSHGTGIGLYMSKMIIEKSMEGSLVSRNEGDGLLTTISLPKETKDWSYSI
jgi:signal transduction histidine kinase